MKDLPQLFDAAPGMYESLVKIARQGHRDTCDTVLISGGDCTCGLREAKKSIAYARGDDQLDEEYEI